MSGCYYVSAWGLVFGWTQIFPSAVTWGLTLLSSVTHAVIFFIYGLFLHAMQFALWAMQLYFQTSRPDPICELYHTYAFPSLTAFYSGGLLAFVFSFAYAFGVVISWFYWLVLYSVAIAIPVLLVFFSYNRWWEVLFSTLLGAVASVLWVVVLKLYITPIMPYLLTMFPCSLLHYNGSYYLTPKQLKLYEEIEECLAYEESIVAARSSRRPTSR